MARIVVADEFDLVVLGAWSALADSLTHNVIGDYYTLDELLAGVRGSRPEVILVGDHLHPDRDVLTLVEQVRAAALDARVLLMGAAPNGRLIADLFVSGISGYLYRGDPIAECLPAAVTAVMRGRPYLSPTANSEYLVAMQSPQPEWVLDLEARQVLGLLAAGRHAGQIALELRIPLRRVYTVRRKLRNRFGVVTNEHLISRAAAEGLIHLEI